MSRFLATLKRYRPTTETAIRTGASQTGIPATIRLDPPDPGEQYRVAFQCLGAGQATTLAVETDGSRRRYPLHSCGTRAGIASVAAGSATVIVIEPTDSRSRILWALTQSRQPPSPAPHTPEPQQSGRSGALAVRGQGAA
ncbi:hypothetical protein [Streptomyces sp. NPDC046985]|uniref:hypothetical protein n=1 Tax=Streptomyces sp. NPDC046985 TaxID=3155377 RepID=UPI0033C60490